MNKKQPLISFCITTYKRPTFVKSTIKTILKQKYENIEIVICEDPSEQTSEQVVKSFKSKNIIYFLNKKNLGMVKGFNKAFSLSHGDFVSILTDDDPPTPDMLEIFSKVYKKYPKMKAMFGGSFAEITTDKIKQVTRLKRGFTSLVNLQKPYGKIEELDSKEFFKQFLNRTLFPHYQWNAGLISKDILKKIGAVPDYNSAHFIDYSYLLKISALTPIIVINKELASFALHELSYGKKKDTLDEYIRGAIGYDKEIAKLAKQFDVIPEYQKFTGDMIIMFLENRARHYKIHEIALDKKRLMEVYDKISNHLVFLKKRRNELYLKLYFPRVLNNISLLRKNYGLIKNTVLKAKKNSY